MHPTFLDSDEIRFIDQTRLVRFAWWHPRSEQHLNTHAKHCALVRLATTPSESGSAPHKQAKPELTINDAKDG
jgi:hypothetical protein